MRPDTKSGVLTKLLFVLLKWNLVKISHYSKFTIENIFLLYIKEFMYIPSLKNHK